MQTTAEASLEHLLHYVLLVITLQQRQVLMLLLHQILTIYVKAGVYEETLPIQIPQFVS